MNTVLSPETFEFAARFVLAGYVAIVVRSLFVSGVRIRPAELLVEAVILSLVIRLLVGVLALTPGYPELPDRHHLLFYAEILAAPALLGAGLGLSLSRGWNRAILRRLALPVTHPSETGYDYAFCQHRPPGPVILTFADGTVVRGWFGDRSLAATDGRRSDIYLERIYAEGDAVLSGVVSLDGIRSIEFVETDQDSRQEDVDG